MNTPNGIRLEAQVAKTGRAMCRICGKPVEKGSYILKILGYRINESYHPECVARITLVLGDVIRNSKLPTGYQAVIRAQGGKIKVGYYKKLDNGGFRFTATQVFQPKKEESNEPKEGPAK